jgi:hypothetical protein
MQKGILFPGLLQSLEELEFMKKCLKVLNFFKLEFLDISEII